MFEVRIHGRGGQGVVTAAEMLSVAAFLEGKHAQAFPSFGSERTGAPVVAFCRIADKEIRLREPIQTPDALIVQDPTLFRALDVTEGLKGNGYLIVNTARTLSEIHLDGVVARLPRWARQGRARDRARGEIRRPPGAEHRAPRRLCCGGRHRLAREPAGGNPARLSRHGRRSQCRGRQGGARDGCRQGRGLRT